MIGMYVSELVESMWVNFYHLFKNLFKWTNKVEFKGFINNNNFITSFTDKYILQTSVNTEFSTVELHTYLLIVTYWYLVDRAICLSLPLMINDVGKRELCCYILKVYNPLKVVILQRWEKPFIQNQYLRQFAILISERS